MKLTKNLRQSSYVLILKCIDKREILKFLIHLLLMNIDFYILNAIGRPRKKKQKRYW